MAELFIRIHRFFHTRRILFYFLFTGLLLLFAYLASRIRFVENISSAVPAGSDNDLTGFVVANLDQTDQIIFNITLRDTTGAPDPDLLMAYGQALTDSVVVRFDTTLIRHLTFRAPEETLQKMTGLVLNHLPAFLYPSDYLLIDSMLTEDRVGKAMQNNLRILASPAGMVMKTRIASDPLGITGIASEKMKSLSAGENFLLYDGCVFTRDLRHLLIFAGPANPASETSANGKMVDGLDDLIISLDTTFSDKVSARYFGSAAVAVANARQIQKDIILTLAISFGLIFLLVGWYFRDFRARLLSLFPAIFGAGLALATLYLIKGSISAISLGIGSVILGLIVDYAMYFMNYYRKSGDINATIRDMTHVIVICAVTTVGALFCLTFLNSTVLRDLGWFALLSVAGAALFTLIFLPQFVHLVSLDQPGKSKKTFIDKMGAYPYHEKKWLLAAILILALISAFFAGDASFEKDMNALNFMTPGLKETESDLDRISNYKLKKVFVVATGATAEEALRHHDRLRVKIDGLRENKVIDGFTDAGPLLTSDSLQQQRIRDWKAFWTPARMARVRELVRSEGLKAGFSSGAFDPFYRLLETDFQPLSSTLGDPDQDPVTREWITVRPGVVMIPSILNVTEERKPEVYESLTPDGSFVIFDRQSLTTRFVEGVKTDFDRLVTLSMIFVTLLLVLSYGRLGLGLMAALPMFGSWLITLGFMGITGETFNIFNIILSSFIFGLGVDHSILMMRGMQRSLKYGCDEMTSYRISVILSSGATLFGAGALFFARHPALHSIALISLVGMITVVILSFTIEPWLFNKLILERSRRNRFPVTFRIFIKTIVTWGNIVLIAILMMIAGVVIKWMMPLGKERKEHLFHRLFSALTRAYIAFTFAYDRTLANEHGERFTKPAIIISNHQSLIETPAFLRFHPKILILTNRWVWNSPVFGPIARLASFFNVEDGIDAILGPLRKKVEEGYSILVFPEGHRSFDQKIQRFHRGAFYLAEKLQIDLLPMLVFGSGDFLSKGAFWGRPNSLHMKIMKRVSSDDTSFGITYQERARNFRKFYIREYEAFKIEAGTPDYYRRLVALNYTLKGPVLEWYVKIKMRLEDNFNVYNQIMPRKGLIMDLGCGYGYLSYLLMFTSGDRILAGIDYDEEKIAVASNCFSRNERIGFRCDDVRTAEIMPAAGYILGDVLHYLHPDEQDALISRCVEQLQPGGVIMIREANADLEARHRKSKLTEFFSTNIGFNRTTTPGKELFFTSGGRIESTVKKYGLSVELIDTKKVTSNNLFVIRK